MSFTHEEKYEYYKRRSEDYEGIKAGRLTKKQLCYAFDWVLEADSMNKKSHAELSALKSYYDKKRT